MKKSIMDYDPLAPTPHRATSRREGPKAQREETLSSLTETANAELALKKQRDTELESRHEKAKERWQTERRETECAYGWETEKLRIRGKTLDQEFEHATRDAPRSNRGEPVQGREKTDSWQKSAREQAHILQEREQALARHEVIWKIREQRMGANTVPAPTPPDIEDARQSPKDEYRQARAFWQDQRDAINEKFDQERDEQRATGITLTEIHRDHVAGPSDAKSPADQVQPSQIDMDVGAPSSEPDLASPERDFFDASQGNSKGRGM